MDSNYCQNQLAQPHAQPLAPSQYDFWAAQACQMSTLAIQAEWGRANAEIENARLRDRPATKQLAEEAYTTTSSGSGRTYTHDRTGRLVELLNREIKRANHITFYPPFPKGEFYAVLLSEVEQPLILTARQFERDAQLIQAFRELPGVQVRCCRTIKQAADLLRQAISERMQVLIPPFWGGWQQSADQKSFFQTFSSGATHADGHWSVDPLLSPQPIPEASVIVAVSRFRQAVCSDLAQPELWLLPLVYHTAALTSLLRYLGHPFPLAFCFLTEDAATLATLRALFCWYGDPALSLSSPPAVFSGRLLRRKDQPLLVEDERGGDASRKNSALLLEVLASGQIPWREGRDSRYFPLQALPVILSSAASSLDIDPNVVTVELSMPLRMAVDGEISRDYLTAFIQFITGHIDKLLDCGDLAAQFISVARSMLLDGSLCPCPVEFEQEPAEKAVFYSVDALCFTLPAFGAVCVRLSQSRPVILHALREADLLLGKPVNGGTPLTRISVWNSYGIRRTERVYKLPRSAFDCLGDPLVFDGEGEL